MYLIAYLRDSKAWYILAAIIDSLSIGFFWLSIWIFAIKIWAIAQQLKAIKELPFVSSNMIQIIQLTGILLLVIVSVLWVFRDIMYQDRVLVEVAESLLPLVIISECLFLFDAYRQIL